MQFLQRLKACVPLGIRHYIRLFILRVRKCSRWISILFGGSPGTKNPKVFYGYDHVPGADEQVSGGLVKFQRMQNVFPNASRRFNVLYLVSSHIPRNWAQLLWFAGRKGAKFVWNQNGVAYPGWHGPGWEKTNAPLAKLLKKADYVFYQSHFCKRGADLFLGQRDECYEILYNAVDTDAFTPASSDPDPQHLVLLIAGSHNDFYRVDTAIRTLALLKKWRTDVRLLIAGNLQWSHKAEVCQDVHNLVKELGLNGNVTLLKPYTQQEAPALFQQAHILLHTQYNDACPGLVVEAMASGLPIVYSHSGGVPELVGESAGVGVASESSWEKIYPPEPLGLAESVLEVSERRKEFAEAARQRAVERFDLRPWLQRHQDVFEEILYG